MNTMDWVNNETDTKKLLQLGIGHLRYLFKVGGSYTFQGC